LQQELSSATLPDSPNETIEKKENNKSINITGDENANANEKEKLHTNKNKNENENENENENNNNNNSGKGIVEETKNNKNGGGGKGANKRKRQRGGGGGAQQQQQAQVADAGLSEYVDEIKHTHKKPIQNKPIYLRDGDIVVVKDEREDEDQNDKFELECLVQRTVRSKGKEGRWSAKHQVYKRRPERGIVIHVEDF
jgi:hypothetical protein